RLLRKKGVGVMLISHKISDFDPAMRSSMNISIVFRTKYEGDLDSIARTLGSDISKVVPSLPVGYSAFLATIVLLFGLKCDTARTTWPNDGSNLNPNSAKEVKLLEYLMI